MILQNRSCNHQKRLWLVNSINRWEKLLVPHFNAIYKQIWIIILTKWLTLLVQMNSKKYSENRQWIVKKFNDKSDWAANPAHTGQSNVQKRHDVLGSVSCTYWREFRLLLNKVTGYRLQKAITQQCFWKRTFINKSYIKFA